MKGTLYGIGLGPGAPDLVTLRAARLIQGATVIAYPTLAGGDSFARAIAADLIPATAREIVIDLPMTPARAPAQAAYDTGASAIAAALDGGHDVITLCEGDPLFYGSFMYLLARLRDRYPVQIVPGVTSVTACAAVAALPLAARNETVTILPGPLPDDELAARLTQSDTIVIMKVGRHLSRLRALIAAQGHLAQATYVERATLGTERIVPLADAPADAPYFSMILLMKGADPWL